MLRSLLRAIPLAAVALAPEVAEAHNVSCGDPYYDPCDAFSGWVDIAVVSTGTIPVDGVLVLQGAFQGDPPGAASVSLTVSDVDVPLAGTVEATDLTGTLIWRPTTPWVAGTTYTITGTATNADADGDCLSLELPIAGEVTIDAAPAPELAPVMVDGVETEQFSPSIDLDTLACCEGVSPSVDFGNCGGGSGIFFDPAECTPTQGIGFFDLALTAAPVPTGPVAGQVAFRLNAPGQPPMQGLLPMFGLSFLVEPICVSVDLVALATNEVVVGPEKCFGEGLAAKLGTQTIDAGEVLDCTLQTCEPNSNSDGWDPENCEPYDPSDPPTTGAEDSGDTDVTGDDGTGGGGEDGQDGEKACACDSTSSPGAGLLLVLGALGLTRRRRVRARARA